MTDGADRILVQWVRDSAFRFFPLIEDQAFGLVLHPFDLATNKELALAGRLESRDWLDTIESDRGIQPLGYLVWAACGKDPGFGPSSLLAEARRGGRYSQAEFDELDYDTAPPSAQVFGQSWHAMLRDADRIVDALPASHVEKAVLTDSGSLYRGGPDLLSADLESERLRFHEGRIRGAWPTFGRPR